MFRRKVFSVGCLRKLQKQQREPQTRCTHNFVCKVDIMWHWTCVLTCFLFFISSRSGVKLGRRQAIISQHWKPVRRKHSEGTNDNWFCFSPFIDYELIINLSMFHVCQEKSGGLAGIFKKSPKPAPRSVAIKVSSFGFSCADVNVCFYVGEISHLHFWTVPGSAQGLKGTVLQQGQSCWGESFSSNTEPSREYWVSCIYVNTFHWFTSIITQL